MLSTVKSTPFPSKRRPTMSDESRPSPLDGDSPFTAEERRRLRGLLVDDDRATWARKKIAVLVPIVVSLVGGLWVAGEWVVKHITLKP